MKMPEFNLIDEPWIRVIDDSCMIQEVSIREALCNAHKYNCLKGELPTQDISTMRLLLAILHTVFYRVDIDGNAAPVEDEETACERWSSLWNAGQFPAEPLIAYLEEWKDRFWLFHETRPFYQTPKAAIGTAYTSAKLNGEVSESANKIRLFSPYGGSYKELLSYGEAARWLLYINAFDDTSAKPKGKGLPSPGVGWLGKLGLICAVGDNLFETLMLNLVFLMDGNDVWDDNQPVWEEEAVRSDERVEIDIPNNPAQLLTLQSRRLLLDRSEEGVTGYFLLGGDFFDRTNAYPEQMTVWSKKDDKSSAVPVYQPKRHDASKKMWHEFSSVFGEATDNRKPGIVSWIGFIKAEGLIKRKVITFQYASVKYGDKDFFVTDVFFDEMTFHVSLLTKLGITWMDCIRDEITKCHEAANYLWRLGKEIAAASGKENQSDSVREQFYISIDMPFRKWIESLDPEAKREEIPEKRNEWCRIVSQIARRVGRELISDAGTSAIVGRQVVVTVKGKEQKKYYSAPEAYNRFQYQIKGLYNQ